MRLSILDHGHSWVQKLIISFMKLIMGGQAPAPVLVMSYRRNFFGKAMAKWCHSSMRNLKHWDKQDAEIIATFVSIKNQCQYCIADHSAVVEKATKSEKIVQQILTNVLSAPINSKLKIVLPFIEKLTLTPDNLTTDDMLSLLNRGVKMEAIEEAINICGVFCTMNRLADSFDFELGKNLKRTGSFLYNFGYASASIP